MIPSECTSLPLWLLKWTGRFINTVTMAIFRPSAAAPHRFLSWHRRQLCQPDRGRSARGRIPDMWIRMGGADWCLTGRICPAELSVSFPVSSGSDADSRIFPEGYYWRSGYTLGATTVNHHKKASFDDGMLIRRVYVRSRDYTKIYKSLVLAQALWNCRI